MKKLQKKKGKLTPAKQRHATPGKKVATRQSVSRYRKQGHDVDTGGKPDPVKIAKVQEEKAIKLRAGTTSSAMAMEWDTRYRKAKALDMERQLSIQMGMLIQKRDVEKQAYECAKVVRDYLLNIPNRIAGELTAALGVKSSESQEKVYQILNRETQLALENLN